jgi:AraC-like DNA-binding protein
LATLEDVLLARARHQSSEPDPAVVAAAEALDRGASVAAVADRLSVSGSTLLRRFTAQVGLTPKRFARVRRLQRLAARLQADREVDWARAAAECGYFDQAHLINDFRELTGMTPGAFRPPLRFEHNHIPLPG